MNIMQTEVVEKKKRGRKPKADKDTKISNIKNEEDENHHIMHLNISRSMCNTTSDNNNEVYESDFCKYNPEMNIPYAYNEDHLRHNLNKIESSRYQYYQTP